jgi:CHASE2 domain-containing sensor protein/signal transduction histidine kinase
VTQAAPRGPWWRGDAGVALALALLAFALAASEVLWRADRVVYDAGLALWTRPAPDDIVIVAIDDASIDAIGRWPWPRNVHATLLEQLATARPRVVVLDLVLSEPDPDPRLDAQLARALVRAAPVVMPVAWQAAPGQALRALEPVAPLRDVVTLGAAEAPVDADGVLRHAFVEAGPSAQPYPHLAVAALRASGQAVHPAVPLLQPDAGREAAGWSRSGQLLVRYLGPPGHLHQVSYVDVLRGAVPASRLAGRHVLVGMTAQGLGDTLATPVNGRRRAMPGVEVLGHTLHTLQGRAVLRPLAPWATGAVSALAVLLLLAAMGQVRTRSALALALLALPLALAASLGALAAGLWCSPVAFGVAAVLAYPLWSWRRLEQGVRQLEDEIARLSAEPGLLRLTSPAAPGPANDALAARLHALREAADGVRRARRFLADTLAGLPTAMLVDDGEGRVLLANPLAAALFEAGPADELQGLDLARLLGEFECQPPVDWPSALAEVRRTRQDLAVPARLAGQGDHLLHAHAVALLGGHHLIVAVSDVAAIRRAERAQQEVLAFVSHDLRAPATSIALLADLHLAGQAPWQGDDLVREMRRLAQRTLSLADDFVHAAQAGQRPLQLEAVDLPALLAEAVADLAAQALAGGVKVEAQAAGAPPLPVVPLDRALVRRALGNLLSNAIRHSPRGGLVTLAVHASAPGRPVFAVQDQGEGLDEQALLRLSTRQDGLPSGAAGGVGFGLLFVQRVAQRHGGALAARPGDGGRGVCFELVLSGNP